jgi:hypothetical protein
MVVMRWKPVDEADRVDVGKVRSIVTQRVTNEVAPKAVTVLRGYVEHWKTKPDFELTINADVSEVSIAITPAGPTARVWGWVSRGVQARVIRPRSRKALKFKAGQKNVFSKGHKWPGIAPRDFEGRAVRDFGDEYVRLVSSIYFDAIEQSKIRGIKWVAKSIIQRIRKIF